MRSYFFREEEIVKKVLAILLAALMVFSMAACNNAKKTSELAVVTDVGQLMDGGFNQGTYEGVKAYAEANGKTYMYQQPANGQDATDNDRVAAMRQCIANGAKVIVAPGFLQAGAMTTVAMESPDVKFIFVDGWALDTKGDGTGDILKNVTAIVYKEQESGYMAGYAAVKDGYTKLGGTFGGGGSNPACNRFAYGFVQGAKDAAEELGVDVEIKISFKYGSAFSASPELVAQMGSWYSAGTEVVFSCGGSMVQSVIQAANETKDGKVIGVDTDQSGLSDRVITSAMKGLSVSVQKVLGELYKGEWDAKLGGQASNLGAADDATGLPISTSRFAKFTADDYNAIYAKVKSGAVTPDANVEGCDKADFWNKAVEGSHVKVTFEE